MPNLLNGIVNGWVKVNSKHVVFPRDDHHRGRGDAEGGHHHHQTSSALRSESLSSGVLDRSRGKSSSNRSKLSPTQTVSTVSSTQSSSTLDPEAMAIKRFNNKRQNNGRRLQRTVSHSDLLREMANNNNSNGEDRKSKSPVRSSTRESRATSRETSYDSHRVSNNRTNNDVESVRLMAGFFGSDVGGSGHHGEKLSQRERRAVVAAQGGGPRLQNGGGPVTTGKYLNEAMFVQQLERSRATRSHRSDASTADGSSISEQSNVKQQSQSVDSHVSLRPVQDHEPTSELTRKEWAHRHKSSPHESAGYEDLERELLAAYEDIRYLRDVSLRREQSSALTKPKSGIMRTSKVESTSLSDASRRLAEITGRYRRQIEQMTRENSRKQHDMHLKHSKVSMICKTLNDESSIRRQEALVLEDEVRDLKRERDELATEVQRLHAEAHLFRQEQQEHALLQHRMTEYENSSLERANKAIRERDELIADLTLKLERTMDTLQIEREQQRQRRQIIFPSSKSTQVNVSSSETTDVAALQEELRRAREAAKASEALLESTRREAAEREVALTVRCEELECRLAEEESQ